MAENICASIDAKSIDLLSQCLVVRATLLGITLEQALDDFLQHVQGQESLSDVVKAHAAKIGRIALDVARMIMAAAENQAKGGASVH